MTACRCSSSVPTVDAAPDAAVLLCHPYPELMVIDRRGEGTSYHYLPPAEFSVADARLISAVWPSLLDAGERIERGASWTTDAPFRETEAAIAAARSRAFSRSKWKRQRSTPLRERAIDASCALPMSPTRWDGAKAIREGRTEWRHGCNSAYCRNRRRLVPAPRRASGRGLICCKDLT